MYALAFLDAAAAAIGTSAANWWRDGRHIAIPLASAIERLEPAAVCNRCNRQRRQLEHQ